VQLGSGAMSNSIDDLTQQSDVIFTIGGNAHEAHPVIGTYYTGAKKRGAKFISADPRRIEISNLADETGVFLQQKAGTDIALINGMCNHIITNKLYNKQFMDERTQDFDAMWAVVEKYTPEYAAEITGVPADKIKKAAEIYAAGPNSAINWGMGIAQRHNAVETVWCLANLAMLCGMIGRPGTGLNPLRGQNNVQGACDMACLPHFLPGYQVLDPDFASFVAGVAGTDPEAAANNANAARKKFEDYWGVTLNPAHGKTSHEMVDASGTGEIKAMYFMGADPATMNANSNHVIESLSKCEFVVVQDMWVTETAKLADVVLPGTSMAEKSNTYVNTERRIQLTTAAVTPVGNSKPDYQILIDLMEEFGVANKCRTPGEIMQEIATLVPSWAGVDYDKINRRNTRFEGVRWPIAKGSDEGMRWLHSASFPVGKAKFFPVEWKTIAEPPCDEYPMVLVTIRSLWHYDNIEQSGKSKVLMELEPTGYLDIHPADMAKYGLKDGDKVKMTSRRGETYATARTCNNIQEGDVFSDFHHKGTHINKLTIDALDPVAKEPELKACAIKIAKA